MSFYTMQRFTSADEDTLTRWNITLIPYYKICGKKMREREREIIMCTSLLSLGDLHQQSHDN